jgi:hypothetical protein
MPDRIHGASTAHHGMSGNLQYYLVFAKSMGAYTNPEPNPAPEHEKSRGVNIQVTGDIIDQSQRNFELLLQSVALRAMPSVMNDPKAVLLLELENAPTLTGDGFIWRFAADMDDIFENFSPMGTPGPVGLLVDELDGIILDSGVRLTTVDGSPSGIPKNIEFLRTGEL